VQQTECEKIGRENGKECWKGNKSGNEASIKGPQQQGQVNKTEFPRQVDTTKPFVVLTFKTTKTECDHLNKTK